MFRNWCIWILALLTIVLAQDDALSKLDGDQIVTLMQTFGEDKCPSPTNNQSWAPIPDNIACASTPRCNFPKEWCSYKPTTDGSPDLETLTCEALKEDCTKAFEEAAASGVLPTPPQPEGSTPSAGGETSPNPEGNPTPAEGETPVPTPVPTPGPEGGPTEGSSPEMTSPTPEVTPEVTTPTAEMTPEATPAVTTPTPEVTTPEITSPAASSPHPDEASLATEATSPLPGSTPGSTPSGGDTSPNSNGDQCCDYHEFCCFWASLGQCESNKLFMFQLCQSSCGTCGCGKQNLKECKINIADPCASGNVTSTPVCPCKSTDLINRDWHHECKEWAEKGYCEKNVNFMKPMCKKSCNICT